MDPWPEEVKRYYDQLAARRGWPPGTDEAFRDSVERYRNLDESQRPREHWRGIDPDDGRTEWLFQTVEDRGQRIAIRQMIVHPSGAIDRYWWRHLEDEAGFLTDQPVDYTEQLVAIPAKEFDALWKG